MSSPEAFGKVAVLMGGWSSEREISLQSGEAVLAALQRQDVDAHAVDADRETLAGLGRQGFNRVWNALHGPGGEDGTVQGLLEILGLPYTGSGVLASALAMDKGRCKALWRGAQIPTPSFRMLTAHSDFTAVAAELGLPIFVKPANEGSSLGMTRVEVAAELEPAWRTASAYDTQVLAERFVAGGEYTAAVLGDQVLPLLKIEAAGSFYDYYAKYESDSTRYRCPCGLPDAEQTRLAALSWQAFVAVGASGWGRVDFLLDEQGAPWFLELNTIPGMTSHSLVPMAARAAGIDFDALAVRILETTLEPDHAAV